MICENRLDEYPVHENKDAKLELVVETPWNWKNNRVVLKIMKYDPTNRTIPGEKVAEITVLSAELIKAVNNCTNSDR